MSTFVMDCITGQTIRQNEMDVLIVKHIDIEGPGLIENCLRQENIPYHVLDLQTGVRLPRLDGVSHVVLLGGPMNVYEEDHYAFLRDEDLFIKEAVQRGRPVLGICLGAQLVAKALGAKVYKAPLKEIGWYDITLTEEGDKDPLFFGFPKTFPVFQWHEDTFETPKAANLIATSTPISHQAFRYGDHVYGLQFHLEVTEEIIQEWMDTYEEEWKGPNPSPSSRAKIMTETEMKIETYTRRGVSFLINFFRRSPSWSDLKTPHLSFFP